MTAMPIDHAAASRRLTIQILFALALGAVVGALLHSPWLADVAWVQSYLVDGLLKLLGDLFRNALQMLVVPLVFFSLIAGVAALSEPAALGRIGIKTMALYLLTTIVAISFALGLGLLFAPGAGVTSTATEFTPPPAQPLVSVLAALVPRNPVEALARGEVLQIIVFAILLGISILLAGQAGQRVKTMVDDINEVVLQLVTIVMKLAPIGVFALLAVTVARLGLDAIAALAKYFVLLCAALLIQLLLIYPLILRLLSGLSPMPWLRKMRRVWLFAFSTSSSNATIPVTLDVVTNDLGVKREVAAFTVPLGATINMDGTAIMQGLATIFVAQVYGIALTPIDLITVVLLATLASIGTAGVPSAGLVMLASVFAQVGLPLEGIALILSVDRLLDMLRTAVNVSGDAMVSVIVGRAEGKFDEQVYAESPAAPT